MNVKKININVEMDIVYRNNLLLIIQRNLNVSMNRMNLDSLPDSFAVHSNRQYSTLKILYAQYGDRAKRSFIQVHQRHAILAVIVF